MHKSMNEIQFVLYQLSDEEGKEKERKHWRKQSNN